MVSGTFKSFGQRGHNHSISLTVGTPTSEAQKDGVDLAERNLVAVAHLACGVHRFLPDRRAEF